jgi:hypothetical protein
MHQVCELRNAGLYLHRNEAKLGAEMKRGFPTGEANAYFCSFCDSIRHYSRKYIYCLAGSRSLMVYSGQASLLTLNVDFIEIVMR